MEKRTLIALALSLVVITGYPYLLKVFYPNYGAVKHAAVSAPSSSSSSVSQAALPDALSASASGKVDTRSNFDVASYEVAVSQNYASIVTLAFTNYVNTEKNTPLKFLDASDGRWGAGAVHLFIDNKEQVSDWQTTTNEGSVHAVSSAADHKITKDIEFSKTNYVNKIRLSYTNSSSAEQKIRLRLVAGSGLFLRNAIDMQYFETNWIDEKTQEHIKVSKGKIKLAEHPYKAVSIKSRHFSSILMPLTGTGYVPGSQAFAEKNNFAAYMTSPEISVKPGQTWSEDYDLFIGLNDVPSLQPMGLEHVVNFGKFDPICKILLGMMQMVHGVVRNYGVAIILLTMSLNILLLPLTKTSFESMRRMQLVQPQMAKLREKYANDATKLNKEVMELYKKYKVNPMGGCLPMVLQMPVFLSLYVALSKSTDLLNSKWLWIKDLASPDAFILPFKLPVLGGDIHILPLVMVGAMVAQQQITQRNMPISDPAMAQQQKMMAFMMPVFFGFLFYPMPSALVIYWLTNTVMTTTTQMILKRKAIAL